MSDAAAAFRASLRDTKWEGFVALCRGVTVLCACMAADETRASRGGKNCSLVYNTLRRHNTDGIKAAKIPVFLSPRGSTERMQVL